MGKIRQLLAKYETQGSKSSLPRHGIRVFGIMLAVSLIAHLLSYINLSFLMQKMPQKPFSMTNKVPMKFKISELPLDDQSKRILEARQEKTAPPKDPRYKGATDHIAEKETKMKERLDKPKAADVGQRGKAQDSSISKENQQEMKTLPGPLNQEELSKQFKGKGTLEMGRNKETAKSPYEKLMPTQQELLGQINAGYQDYIDEELEVGDKVDINTTEFRYLGYFVNMRKSIELVWNYPSEAARRGLQGEVGLEFTILKDGSTRRIRVVRSSGYPLLDNAIVEAIKLASPFSPLPANIKKARIVVKGNFRYVLNSYAVYH